MKTPRGHIKENADARPGDIVCLTLSDKNYYGELLALLAPYPLFQDNRDARMVMGPVPSLYDATTLLVHTERARERWMTSPKSRRRAYSGLEDLDLSHPQYSIWDRSYLSLTYEPAEPSFNPKSALFDLRRYYAAMGQPVPAFEDDAALKRVWSSVCAS